jgi:micrococcal nuclease
VVASRLVKTLLLAAAVLGVVACGDTTAPATTQSEASPSTSAAATPTATAKASPPASPAGAVLTFVNAPLTVGRGSNATLQAKTAPNTSCSIEVDFKSGPSKAAGLGAATSDAAGNVSWTWKVGANTTPGSWPIIVTCGSASAQTAINVT